MSTHRVIALITLLVLAAAAAWYGVAVAARRPSSPSPCAAASSARAATPFTPLPEGGLGGQSASVRFEVGAEGLRLEGAPPEPWSARLSFESFGRGDAQAHVGASEPPRIEPTCASQRRGDLVEWYSNRADKIEQGFTVERRPSGEGPLTLKLRLSGDLTPRQAGPDEIEFADASGEVRATYSGFAAADASGRKLRLWLSTGDKLIAIHVDDVGAEYPVVIDPWLAAAAVAHAMRN